MLTDERLDRITEYGKTFPSDEKVILANEIKRLRAERDEFIREVSVLPCANRIAMTCGKYTEAIGKYMVCDDWKCDDYEAEVTSD